MRIMSVRMEQLVSRGAGGDDAAAGAVNGADNDPSNTHSASASSRSIAVTEEQPRSTSLQGAPNGHMLTTDHKKHKTCDELRHKSLLQIG